MAKPRPSQEIAKIAQQDPATDFWELMGPNLGPNPTLDREHNKKVQWEFNPMGAETP